MTGVLPPPKESNRAVNVLDNMDKCTCVTCAGGVGKGVRGVINPSRPPCG